MVEGSGHSSRSQAWRSSGDVKASPSGPDGRIRWCAAGPSAHNIGMDFLDVKKEILDELKQVDRKVQEKYAKSQRRRQHQLSHKGLLGQAGLLGGLGVRDWVGDATDWDARLAHGFAERAYTHVHDHRLDPLMRLIQDRLVRRRRLAPVAVPVIIRRAKVA